MTPPVLSTAIHGLSASVVLAKKVEAFTAAPKVWQPSVEALTLICEFPRLA